MKLFFAFALLTACSMSGAGPDARELFERARMLEERNQSLTEAIRLFGEVVAHASTERALAARAQYEEGVLYERLGKKAEAQRAFRAVLRNFADERAVVLLARLKLPSGTRGGGIAVRQVWSDDKVDGFGAPSPDGNYFSLQWTTGDVGIREIATGQMRRLSRDAGAGAQALWSIFSPDGKRVAYSWVTKTAVEIRVIGISGTGMRTLYRIDRLPATAEVRDWSPDGKTLLAVVYRDNLGPKLTLIPVDGGASREISAKGRFKGGRACFSRDGAFIAYEAAQADHDVSKDIYVLAVNGNQDLAVVEHPANDELAGWSPSGAELVFISDRSGSEGIWRIPVSAGKPAGAAGLLKPDVGPIGPIALLRNGSFYYSAPVRSTEAYVAEIDAAAARVVSAPAPLNQRFTGAKTSAVWSPEGESLAYVVAQRGRLCILSMDTHKVNEIVPKMGSVGMVLKWHPDGKSVFVLGSGNDGTRGAYRVSLDDGSAQAIAPYANDRPAWSPDANMIYYGGRALFARDVSTGKITELYRYLTADAFNNPNIDVSPDGRQLAVMLRNVPAGHCSIAILPATGGEPKIIYSVKQAWFGGNTLAWTRDGKHILAAQIENNRSRIMSISVATGEAKAMGIDMPGIIRHLRLNPDGKRIAFVNGDEKQEIWVMENFLDDTRGAR